MRELTGLFNRLLVVFKKPQYETNDERQVMVPYPIRYVHFSVIGEHNIGKGRQQMKGNRNWMAKIDPSLYTQSRAQNG